MHRRSAVASGSTCCDSSRTPGSDAGGRRPCSDDRRELLVKQGQRRTVLVAALALCSVAAYLPAVSSGWVWDDVNLVQPSPALRDLDGLRQAVATDLYRQAAPRLEASPYWRPLPPPSYSLGRT